MPLFTLAGRCLAFLLFLPVIAWEDLTQTLAEADVVTKYFDWEWALIRIDNVEGPFEGADYSSAADAQVVVTAVGAVEPPVAFDKPLSTFESLVKEDTNSPQWYEIGMVAYQKNSVSQLEVILKDKDVFTDDNLLTARVDLPVEFDKWVGASLKHGDYSLNISLRRSTTPLFTNEEHEQMNLQEEAFELKGGSKAILAYVTSPTNDKAVLYFPGKEDSFTHPHILEMYQDKGYDFFTLDPRSCGRSRRFLDDSAFRQAHSIGDFDIYQEEIRLALDFIRNQNKSYTKPLAHTHSAGALMALNYALHTEDEPFDGYILNGPFLNVGHASFVERLVFENAGALKLLGIKNLVEVSSLTAYQLKLWILNRFNTSTRPVLVGHITTEWAKAVSDIQNRILERSTTNPITTTPVLLIASMGDIVVQTSDSQERMSHIAANHTEVILRHNSHDVTYSATKELNEEAIAAISQWLDSPEPTHFGSFGGSKTLG